MNSPFSLHAAAILAHNDSSVTVTETVFGGHEDLGVRSQQSWIDSTLYPSMFNSSKLTGHRQLTVHVSTPVSADLLVWITNSFLLIFNNTDGLDLLHRFALSCDPTGLEIVPGVYSSSRGRFPAIALVECSSRVYGVFSTADGGFRLEKRALYLPPSAEKTIIKRQDGSVYVFIDGGDVLSGGLGASDYPGLLFRLVDVSSSCSDLARLWSYGSNRFVLRCANNQDFLCNLQGSCTQVQIQATGEHKLYTALNRGQDIAVAANSSSITVYRDSFAQSCSLNVSTLKSYLTMTPDDVILVLVTPNHILTYNITSGCEPNPTGSLNITHDCRSIGCATPKVFGRYLVVISSSHTMYNVTIIDTHSSGTLYTTQYTQLPLVYQLNIRMSMTPPTTIPLPSPSTTHSPALQSPIDVTYLESSQLAMPILSSPTVSTQLPSAVDNTTQVHSATPFVITTSSSLFIEPTATPLANMDQLIIAAIASSVVVLLLAVGLSAGVIICVCMMLVHKRRKDLNRQLPTTAEIELKQQNRDPTGPPEAKPVQETDLHQESYVVAAVQESPPNGNTVCLITDSLERFQEWTTDLSTQRTSPPPTSPRLQQPPAFRY